MLGAMPTRRLLPALLAAPAARDAPRQQGPHPAYQHPVLGDQGHRAATGLQMLEHGRGARPLGPVAVGAIRGLDQRAQGSVTQEAFDRGGIFRPDDRNELLPFTRFHGQVL